MGLLCALGFTIDRHFGIQGRMSTATVCSSFKAAASISRTPQLPYSPGERHGCSDELQGLHVLTP